MLSSSWGATAVFCSARTLLQPSPTLHTHTLRSAQGSSSAWNLFEIFTPPPWCFLIPAILTTSTPGFLPRKPCFSLEFWLLSLRALCLKWDWRPTKLSPWRCQAGNCAWNPLQAQTQRNAVHTFVELSVKWTQTLILPRVADRLNCTL